MNTATEKHVETVGVTTQSEGATQPEEQQRATFGYMRHRINNWQITIKESHVYLFAIILIVLGCGLSGIFLFLDNRPCATRTPDSLDNGTAHFTGTPTEMFYKVGMLRSETLDSPTHDIATTGTWTTAGPPLSVTLDSTAADTATPKLMVRVHTTTAYEDKYGKAPVGPTVTSTHAKHHSHLDEAAAPEPDVVTVTKTCTFYSTATVCPTTGNGTTTIGTAGYPGGSAGGGGGGVSSGQLASGTLATGSAFSPHEPAATTLATASSPVVTPSSSSVSLSHTHTHWPGTVSPSPSPSASVGSGVGSARESVVARVVAFFRGLWGGVMKRAGKTAAR